jgi:hypothetical protein
LFKASIALVVFAFATLAYGWVRGNDLLLYGSIVFSALAGLALMRATVEERRRHPELTRKGRKAAQMRDRDRKSLAELRTELSGLKGEISAAGGEGSASRRKPLKPFGDTARTDEVEAGRALRERSPLAGEEERRAARERSVLPGEEEVPVRRVAARERSVLPSDEEVPVRRLARERSVLPGQEEVPMRRPARDRAVSLEQRVRRPESRQPSGPADTDDFRSRLSAVLGEGGAPPASRDLEPDVTPRPRPASRLPDSELEDDEIGSDWIRIDDLPRLRRPGPRAGGSAAASGPASPAKRRPAPATKRPAAAKDSTTPRAPRGSKSAPKAAPGSETPK